MLSRARAHPVRAACFVAISVVLVFLVVVKSMPYALAPLNPDLALTLNPNNPAALIAKAQHLRQELLRASGLLEKGASGVNAGLADAIMIDQLPKAETERADALQSEMARLRAAIRELTLRAIASDPLNAEAFRLGAETATDYDEARALMEAAAKRSRRDAASLFWLLNDRYYQKDFPAALSYADTLLRTHPELSAYVFAYLALVAEEPDGAQALVHDLAGMPPWRASFFNALPQRVKNAETPLKLMQALKENGKPPVNRELAPYLDFLLSKNEVEAAYNAWLQFLPEDELNSVALLTHVNFERGPSGLSFDWRMARGLNAVADFESLGPEPGRALHVVFGRGRVQFPELSQIVLLPSGKYRLTGKLKGAISGKRGLRWQLRCLNGARKVLGETDMLMGKSQDWRVFEFEAEVTQGGDCRGQVLRLFHDSRSASEELLDGEVWFAALSLQRVADQPRNTGDEETSDWSASVKR